MLTDNRTNVSASLVAIAVVIAGLTWGREILTPLAVAIIIAFILAPIVRWMTERRVPEIAAVSFVLGAVLAVVVAGSVILSTQLLSLAADLGSYRQNIIEKVRIVSGIGRDDGLVKKASDAVGALATAIEREFAPPLATPPARETSSADRPVVVAQKGPSGEGVLDYVKSVASPLAQAALTLLFTLFLLLQHQDLRDRIVRVAGTDNLSGTTAAMSDAGARLSQLFLAQAALNAAFGVFVGLALAAIGVPNPVLWGALTAVMRFVPFIGSFVAAVPPILLSLGVDPGWGMAIMTLLLFVIGEPLMGHVIEPMVLGKSAGLSPFAMVVSASVWTLMWGPVGLILAAPLTMGIVVLGRYVPGIEFLSVMLGDVPALRPEQEFYRRVLAEDPVSAVQAMQSADMASAAVAADTVILPALRLAAHDNRRGRLDEVRIRTLGTTMDEVIDLMADLYPLPTEWTAQSGAPSTVIVAARGPVDIIAARFVAAMLRIGSSCNAEAQAANSGLTALSELRARPGRTPIQALIVTTVGGVDAKHLEIISRRAARVFPESKVSVLDVSRVWDQKQLDTASPAAVMTHAQLGSLLASLDCLPQVPATPARNTATALDVVNA